ncbi:hypothetical protein P4O66_000021 [Electrophorus voltai]|uniref:Reverse transcriptase domain-containing protein n=1 Tax=Electrophorus voltai TaxID=2609070 RepID=A0AAD9E5Y2_9TELE|nr:hypothetical protein P4O66_000021 [Electrophorus voltai]
MPHSLRGGHLEGSVMCWNGMKKGPGDKPALQSVLWTPPSSSWNTIPRWRPLGFSGLCLCGKNKNTSSTICTMQERLRCENTTYTVHRVARQHGRKTGIHLMRRRIWRRRSRSLDSPLLAEVHLRQSPFSSGARLHSPTEQVSILQWSTSPFSSGAGLRSPVEQVSVLQWSRSPFSCGAGLRSPVVQVSVLLWSRSPFSSGAGLRSPVEQVSVLLWCRSPFSCGAGLRSPVALVLSVQSWSDSEQRKRRMSCETRLRPRLPHINATWASGSLKHLNSSLQEGAQRTRASPDMESCSHACGYSSAVVFSALSWVNSAGPNSTGAPQGCVLSPLLYSLYTYDCTATSSSNIIVKFADDTVVVGLISDNDERAYLEEIKHLENWCQENNLLLNVSKTKELIVDCSKKQERHYQPVRISGTTVERVDSFRYLGVHISQDLSWSRHTNSLAKKARQRLYHLRRLRDFRLPSKVLWNFYTCTIESILTGNITVWFGNSTKQDRQAVQRVVRSAERITHTELPDLQTIYYKRCQTKARKIVKDPTHPNNRLFSLLSKSENSNKASGYYPAGVGLSPDRSGSLPRQERGLSPDRSGSLPRQERGLSPDRSGSLPRQEWVSPQTGARSLPRQE